jgi:DTW domain-containing protein
VYPNSPFVPRAVCYRCHKPQITCICSTLPRVENRTPVLVFQHPRERLHPIGTARFARLGLMNSRVEVAWNAGAREAERPTWVPEDAALLYPSAHARDLRELSAERMPRALVVLDGTWSTVRTLYRDKLWLHRMPHYRFTPGAPGRYRLRREPQADYVSTIEAIVEALHILEPNTSGFAELLAAFDAMIDQQLTYVGRGGAHERIRKRRRPASERRLPHALVRGFERLVVVYGESARPKQGPVREFVYFTALALASGARFERLTRPESGPPDPEHLRHMGLSGSNFDAAHSGDSFTEAWTQFLASCDRSPVLAAWNQRTLDLLARVTGSRRPEVVLKGAYRSVFGIDAQSLEQIVAQRGLNPPAHGFQGRAGRRLDGAVAVTQLLHSRAISEKSRTSNIGQTATPENPDDEQSSDRTLTRDPAAPGHGHE